MTCKEAENQIREYINDELSLYRLNLFIRHIRNCPACKEELETHFMIDRALDLLDREELENFDLRPLLEADLQEKEKRLSRRRRKERCFLFLILLCMAAGLLVYLDLFGIFKVTWLLP